MEILILSCLPTRESAIISLEDEYKKRLARWAKVKIIESTAVAKAQSKPSQDRQQIEDSEFLDLIKPGTLPFLLDEGGKQISTEEMAKTIKNWQISGVKRIVLGIGSADGWSKAIKKEVKESWSLSRLTFPYQLARLILIEQLYRSFSILNNSPYHRGNV